MRINIVGKKFGRWTVISEADKRGRDRYFNSKCECGTKREVSSSSLRSGSSRSCGCVQKETRLEWLPGSMRVCSKCKQEKPIEEYSHYKSGHLIRVKSSCMECCSKYEKNRFSNDEKLRERRRTYKRNYENLPENIEKRRAKSKSDYRKDQRNYLIWGARKRAKKLGLPCSIRKEDIVIPEYCPVLGIKLQIGNGKLHDASPSLDRVDGSGGYTKDNVCVISYRANRIKIDASKHELQAIVKYLEEFERVGSAQKLPNSISFWQSSPIVEELKTDAPSSAIDCRKNTSYMEAHRGN